MVDFTFTFLGTGTSQGIPMLTCDCRVCKSSDPRDCRSRAAAYVQTPEFAFVVDAGPDFRQQALRENIRRVDALVLTHGHTDHMMGFDDLRAYCHDGRELPVYGSGETIELLRQAFAFAFDGRNKFPSYINPVTHIVDSPFRLGDTELIPLPLPHGRMTTFGYLFIRAGRKVLAYLSDCKAVPPPVAAQIEGVDTLILDALRYREHPTHMNVTEALEVAAAMKARETWFTHLCHEIMHSELEATLPPGVRIAYDGLKLRL